MTLQFHPARGQAPAGTDDERVLRRAATAILRALGDRAYTPVDAADIEIGGVPLRYRIVRLADEGAKRRATIELFLNPAGDGAQWLLQYTFRYFDFFE